MIKNKMYVLIIGMILLVLSLNTINATFPTDLVAYYNFDEGSGTTAIDVYNNYDSYINGATINQTGKINRSYSFDGTNDGVHTPNFSLTGYSISLWVNPSSFKTGTNNENTVINTGGNASDGNNFVFNGNTAPSNQRFCYYGTSVECSTSNFNTGTWYHIVISINASLDTVVYINGALDSALTGALNSNTSQFVIGARQAAYWRAFTGYIDEVAIFDKFLTGSEVEALYNSGDGLTYTPEEEVTPPSVILNSPPDYNSTTNTIIPFNVSVFDYSGVGIKNVSLYIDGILNETNTSGVNGTYYFTKTLSYGYHNWSVSAFNNDSYSNYSNTRFTEVKLVSGIDIEGDYTGVSYDISGQALSAYGIVANATNILIKDVNTDEVYLYFINGTYYKDLFDTAAAGNGFIGGLAFNGTFFWATDTQDNKVYIFWANGTYKSNFDGDDSCGIPSGITTDSNYIWTTSDGVKSVCKYFMNGTYTGDYFNTSITNGYGITKDSFYFWITDFDSAEIYKYYGNGTYTGVSYDTFASGNEHPTGISLYGDYFYVTDSIADKIYKYSTFYSGFTLNSESHNNYAYETDNETYSINISLPTGYTPTDAYLTYNGTNYSLNVYSDGINHILNTTINIPTTYIANLSFNYNWYTTTGYLETSQTYYQTINPIQFGLCNATLTIPYLNYSFKDMVANTPLNGTIVTSTFVYSIANGLANKTYSYITTNNYTNYLFCSLPGNKTYYIDPYLQYKLGTQYPQNTYNPSSTAYQNTSNNITLYLFNAGEGTATSFQVLNILEQSVSGVLVNALIIVSNEENYTVGTGTTDSSGLVTFWLNDDYTYQLTFSKDGYNNYTVNIQPTQTLYTVTLSSLAASDINDYTRGIKLYVYPKSKELQNNTTYTFAFNLTSSYWDVDEFGFNLRLSNGTVLAGGSSGVEGTAGSISYNVSNQSIIYMDYHYLIDGNYTNGTTYWIVTNSLNTEYSIKTFFTDLNTYLDTELFGLQDFGRYIISFLLLFLVVGIVGYKYGVVSPFFMSVLTFAVVFFLDVITGILPAVRGIEHLLTYVAGLIVMIIVIKEVAT